MTLADFMDKHAEGVMFTVVGVLIVIVIAVYAIAGDEPLCKQGQKEKTKVSYAWVNNQYTPIYSTECVPK